jgi:hypothetical protein
MDPNVQFNEKTTEKIWENRNDFPQSGRWIQSNESSIK